MRHHDLRVLLEVGGDDDERHVLFDRVEVEQQIAAHVEVELAGGEQQAIVGLRTALHDGHVEAVFLVSAVGDRLIIAAVFGLGEPVGAVGHLVERERARSARGQGEPGREDYLAPIIGISPAVPRLRLSGARCNSGARASLAMGLG